MRSSSAECLSVTWSCLAGREEGEPQVEASELQSLHLNSLCMPSSERGPRSGGAEVEAAEAVVEDEGAIMCHYTVTASALRELCQVTISTEAERLTREAPLKKLPNKLSRKEYAWSTSLANRYLRRSFVVQEPLFLFVFRPPSSRLLRHVPSYKY